MSPMSVLVATVAKGAPWSVCEGKPGRPSGGTVRVHGRPCGPLSPPKLTDAELLCLAVAQVVLGLPYGPSHCVIGIGPLAGLVSDDVMSVVR